MYLHHFDRRCPEFALYQFRFHDSISEIPASHWNRLASTTYPFLRHEFLHALESSQSVCLATGWQPRHLAVYKQQNLQDGAPPVAVMPLYLKYHSFGEYVFDFAWADAWQRQGLDYYPKLLTAIPFTPCGGPRLLIDASLRLESLLPSLLQAIEEEADRQQASSWHLLFPEPELATQLGQQGLLARQGSQFHWFNRGYRNFDELLATFSSRKRKSIRKERQALAGQALQFDWITGRDITEADLARFYRYYRNTYLERGQEAYLRPAFFESLVTQMPEALRFVMVRQAGESVAGAMYLQDEDCLYGRYWGCEKQAAFLHFETCYYQGIEHCIAEGLQRFDAGAQGEHKLRRGFEPVPTVSMHWLAEPGFRPAVSRFCRQEADYIRQYMAAAREHLPYRREG